MVKARDVPWYPGKRFYSHTLPYLEWKIGVYSEKFKSFDKRIIYGCGVCYRHSPLYRAHVDSPRFGETMGWRVTNLWTDKPSLFPSLSMIGPLDLGLYSVRIDGVLGRSDVDRFVRRAKRLTVFKKYVEATEHFILRLLALGETHWLNADAADVKEAVKLCAEYSPTFREVLTKNGDGWGLVKLWVDDPEKISSLRRLYPLDVGMYCVRLDSVIHGVDLAEFQEEAKSVGAFRLLPLEVLRFVSDVRAAWGV